ncbi:HPr family phosphocarrier protein [Fusibacter ferrireducens]|uniref:HPr family phosphocarrier protein n=1 Tax=Fusibacter ferrireducens TaxID=2785058 RepID=A0ABR9ZTG5_9FIRM|nr:HPr family phosphocarrier protein [Fusibacter ferrireducens]MBF4693165.1 HPr family phosphocarrier protein [Fusibacter ferrireducens]
MRFTINDFYGIHARVATRIVNLVDLYSGELNFVVGDKSVSASSVIGLMQMGVKQGDIVTLEYIKPMKNQVEFEKLLLKIIEG